MEFNYDCLHCHINQGLKASDFLGLTNEKKEILLKKILASLSTADFRKQNPELMADTWKVITSVGGDKNPYRQFKWDYNKMIMDIAPDLENSILKMDNLFKGYVYASILGNIIDLGPSHEFETDNWLKQFTDELHHMTYGIDDSDYLYEELTKAKASFILATIVAKSYSINCSSFIFKSFPGP